MSARPVVASARLAWTDGHPYSLDHDDVFFGRDAARECERVFLALNDLPERFARLPPRSTFTIGEIGFGTGLNLVTTMRAFLRSAPSDASLHFISCDYRPLDHADFARLRLEPELAALHGELARAYPPLLPGWQRRLLAGERVRLSLFFGPGQDALASARGVQAWYLDGFAPQRNPEAWQPDLFEALARASAPGATLATFSAAGEVRRALAAAGFAVERISATPHKKHYTRARLPGTMQHRTPPALTVIGAGLAGAAVARSLALRGHDVTVIERLARPAAATSANPWAVLHARLTSPDPELAQLRLAGFSFAAHRLADLTGFRPIGLLERPGPAAPGRRMGDTARWLARCWPHGEWLDAPAASERAGLAHPGALWLADGGCADLAAVVGAWLDHPRIEVRPASRCDDPRAIHCTGVATPNLAMRAVPGVIERFTCARRPRCVLSGNGYLLPDADGIASGATFEDRGATRGLSARSRIEDWLGIDPGPAQCVWRGVRAVTADRLPYVGRDLRGRLVSCGFAGAGLALAPLAGEIIASHVDGEPRPDPASRLAPDRPGARGVNRRRSAR